MSGYQLRPFTADERRSDGWVCSTRGCPNQPTYMTLIRFVSGSKERWSERKVCDDHAARFAGRYGVRARVGAPWPS